MKKLIIILILLNSCAYECITITQEVEKSYYKAEKCEDEKKDKNNKKL